MFFLVSLGGCGEGNKIKIIDDSTGGASTLVSTTLLKANEGDCEAGGIEIETGIDENKDGLLSAEEIDTTKIICHGNTGYNSLLAISDEATGENCAGGGKNISSGLDKNRDDILNDTEITETEYICNGLNGLTGIDGVDGVDGKTPPENVGEKITTALFCRGSIDEYEGINWSYYNAQHLSGNVVVTASIILPDVELSKTFIYSSSQIGVTDGAVRIVFDIIDPNNFGTWQFELADGDPNKMTLYYYDDDLGEQNPNSWTAGIDSGTCDKFEYG